MTSMIATLPLRPHAAAAPQRLPAPTLPAVRAALASLDVAVVLAAGFAAAAASVGLATLHGDRLADILSAAVFLPFVMARVGGYATDERLARLCRNAVLGAAVLFGGLAVIAGALGGLDRAAADAMVVWAALSLAGMMLVRVGVRAAVTALVARGRGRETVAIVGTEAGAFRLAAQFGRRDDVALLGVYAADGETADGRFAGTLADLVALGRSRAIDRIVIAGALAADARLDRTLHVLKSLAVDIDVAPAGAARMPALRMVEGGAALPLDLAQAA